MVVLTASLVLGALVAAVAGFFTVQAVSTVMHLVAAAGTAIAGIALYIQSSRERPLKKVFSSSNLEYIVYGFISVVASFVLFRVLEALITALTGLAAVLLVLAVVGSIVFGASTVIRVIGKTLGFIITALDSGGR